MRKSDRRACSNAYFIGNNGVYAAEKFADRKVSRNLQKREQARHVAGAWLVASTKATRASSSCGAASAPTEPKFARMRYCRCI